MRDSSSQRYKNVAVDLDYHKRIAYEAIKQDRPIKTVVAYALELYLSLINLEEDIATIITETHGADISKIARAIAECLREKFSSQPKEENETDSRT